MVECQGNSVGEFDMNVCNRVKRKYRYNRNVGESPIGNVVVEKECE